MAGKKPLPNISLVDEELAWMDVEDALFDMQETGRELNEVWEEFRKGNVPADLHDDAPLRLEDAVCLPELAGVYTVNPEFRERSESITVKTLRLAIERKELAVVRPNTKNLYVTRRTLREWLEACQGQGNPRTSSSGKSAAMRKDESRTRPSGTSTTMTSNTSLDAARRILQELKKPSTTTSSKSTRRK
ncbi:hypothetical protein [Mesorhizobium sp. B2-2-2]|uniref:hypothetical protein n=1 Tax=Mesorhizobium sp. B2-2-2 TaxID=2589964 RepID=UPI0015E41D87|nr:hypothetical protein [Mesorhizobium sp. B2-2-2]